jgi:hypothetical protein
VKYLNLNLEAFDYKKENDTERFRVRVSNSPAGEQKLGDAETVSLPDNLRQRLRPLEKRQLDLQEMIALGEGLGGALFPPKVRSLLSNSKARLAEGESLRVRLMLDTYALADLPWEFVYLADPDTPADQKGAEGFLVLDRRLSLVRYQVLEQAIGKLDPVAVGALRLVALLSNPQNTPELNLAVERQNIEKALKEVPTIQAEFFPQATIDVLLEAMIKGAHIFHFSGHGKFEGEMGSSYGSQEGKGFLSLTGEDGGEVAFSAQKLALSLAGRGVRFAMLGACESSKVDQVNAWTGIASALTRAGIPAVVGMQFTVRDGNAIAFSKSFYLALAAGQTIDEAVTEGRLAIFARSDNDDRDWGVPVLYLRAEEGVIFPKRAERTVQPVGNGGPAAAVAPAGPESAQPLRQIKVDVDSRTLREAMVQFFSMSELADVCLDVQEALADAGINLEVNLEMVGGEGKRAKVLNLIQYLERRGYLSYLVSAVRKARPEII